MKMLRRLTSKIYLCVCVALIACSSPEEQAQQHYDRGLELLVAEDATRAQLEFQNAVKLNARLKGAWLQLGRIDEANRNYTGALGNFRKALELDPKHFDTLYLLAKLELSMGHHQEALENVNHALSLNKTNSDVYAVRAAVLFRFSDREGARKDAEQSLALNKNNPDALAVLANDRMLDEDFSGALMFVDQGLSTDPRNIGLLLFQIRIYEQMKRYDKVETALRQLIEFDLGTRRARQALVRLLKELGRFDDAEKEARAQFEGNPTDTSVARDLINLIKQTRGEKAARAELESLIGKHSNVVDFQLELAKLEYASQGIEAAGAVLAAIVARDEPEADVQRARIVLARLLMEDKKFGRAAGLIEDILALDEKNADALALRASIRLKNGDATNAIADLREALSQEPQSVLLLRLLGGALEKQGSTELAQERFAQAVKLSRFEPALTLDYVQLLLRHESIDQAETVLSDAISVNPRNVQLLQILGQVRLQKNDWSGAQAVAESLKKIGVASGARDVILGRAQLGQKKYEAGIATFEAIHAANPRALRPMLTLVRAYLRGGQRDRANKFLQSALEANPENAEALVLMGTLKILEQNPTEAESAFRRSIEAQPKSNLGYLALAKLYMDQEKTDEAQDTLEQARKSLPDNMAITLALASLLQKKNDVNGVIVLYEETFKALDQNTPAIVLNNLASLLSDHRADQQSLDRAAKIAKNLTNTKVPVFRDTIGWIAYRQRRYSEALRHLEYAVAKQPRLVLARFHLGQVYVALERKEDAYDQFVKALQLTKDDELKRTITNALSGVKLDNAAK